MLEVNSSPNFIRYILYLYWFTLILLVITSAVVEKGTEVLLINGNHSPSLDFFFVALTRLGEGWVFIPLVVVLLFIRYKYVIIAISIAGFHSLCCLILKKFVFSHQLRPKNVLDNQLLHFVEGIDVHGYQSFPSGHTATIICFVVYISLLSKHRLLSVILLCVGLAVAYSRIYLLQHFLIDVTAGAFIGAISTFLIWHLFEHSRLPLWTNSSLQLKSLRTKIRSRLLH